MPSYYKVMLGRNSMYAQEALAGGWIGIDASSQQDLTPFLNLPEPEFREKVKAFLTEFNSDAPKGTISQYTTTLWRVAIEIQVGDRVICPDGVPGPVQVRVGDVIGPYQYQAGAVLAHRRAVQWLPQPIKRKDMTDALQNSSGGITTIIDLTEYGPELSSLAGLGGLLTPTLGGSVGVTADAVKFGLEKELENFLVSNWTSTELGKDYDIYQDTVSGASGQQYQTSVGPIDILAIKKDKSEWLVLELKRGRVGDQVIGQVQRYMGYVKKEMAENQQVRGLIIGLEDDPKLQYALQVAPNISFYTYQVSFKLNHSGGETV